jgi:hypothetical protein
MTYQRFIKTLAEPVGLAMVNAQEVISPTTNTILSFSGFQTWSGSPGISISGGGILLTAGSWYLLEGTAQALSATFDTNDFLSYRWYDNSAAAYIGSLGRVAFNLTSSDALLASYDERAVVLYYAAASVVLTLRCVTNSGVTRANTTADAQNIYAGLGRALVVRLDGPAP